ncbi:MAG TPA: dTMP kinase [Lachnospiraceae bacterium]|nr:dTMP kinase [Lachnospiraceae bacterium]
MSQGIFITMEGPDGSGKSTQIELLKQYLEKEGFNVLITREPGGTAISEAIREIILNKDFTEMSPVTEMLLYASARAQLIHEVVGPALEKGQAVISDRFVDSSLVYQGIARGLGVEKVYEVNKNAIGKYMPDVTFLLDLPAEEGIKRKKGQKELDRMEMEGIEFHMKVAQGYRDMADRFPDRIKVVDATQPIQDISNLIINEVSDILSSTSFLI